MGGAYLRAFSERVADVPSYLKRHLALIRDLDEKVQALQKEIEVHSKRKLASAKASEGGSKRQKQSEDTYDVEPAVTRLLSLADEKVTIAAQVYDFIDKHIQHLDEDLKALTVEIDAEKQQGPGASGPGTRTTAAAGAAANGGGGARAPKRGSTGAAGSSKQGDGGGKEGKGGKPKTTKAGASNKPRTGGGRGVAVEAAPPGAVDAPPVLLAHGPGEHEPLYCYCQKPSHGNMVACDNDECRFEWFHYECVGLTEPPGDQEWYCPECLQLMSAKKAGASGRGGQAKK